MHHVASVFRGEAWSPGHAKQEACVSPTPSLQEARTEARLQQGRQQGRHQTWYYTGCYYRAVKCIVFVLRIMNSEWRYQFKTVK